MITKVERINELQECWRDWLNNDYMFNRGQHWVLHFDNNLSYQEETYNIERLMKKFLRRLDRRCYKKQRNRIERINVIEGIGSQKRNHCHLLLNQSSHLDQEQFKSEVLSSIDDTSKYHSIFYTKDRSQIKKMNETGRYFGFGSVRFVRTIDSQIGILDYLRKEVGISDDCIDMNNSRLVRRI